VGGFDGRAAVKQLGDEGGVANVCSEAVAPAVIGRDADFGWVTAGRREVSRSGFRKGMANWLELDYIIDHEVVATEPVHLHGEPSSEMGRSKTAFRSLWDS
jgi:hypothetical protein